MSTRPGSLGAPTAADRGRRQREAVPDWYLAKPAVFSGNNEVQLLVGGDALFPAMCEAIEAARESIWLATYIYNGDPSAQRVTDALVAAARRGVQVYVVVDGFGSLAALPRLRAALEPAGIQLAVFRPLHRWTHWFQPSQLRRLHLKLCTVDHAVGFVGGINILDDRLDLRHGWSELPRLDYAVQVRGPVVGPIEHAVEATWKRARLGRHWRNEALSIARQPHPVQHARQLMRQLRPASETQAPLPSEFGQPPMRAAFIVRDNLRDRRSIERSYITGILRARREVDIVSAYFYPGRALRRALRGAARRGVRVRLLLQGKVDYRIAGLAARVLYDELLADGIQIFEYTPAFLHAKAARVDDQWATVGSSNLDPLSLLLNLEGNLVVRDPLFVGQLAAAIQSAIEASVRIAAPHMAPDSPRARLRRALVGWCARAYLRMAGTTGKY